MNNKGANSIKLNFKNDVKENVKYKNNIKDRLETFLQNREIIRKINFEESF